MRSSIFIVSGVAVSSYAWISLDNHVPDFNVTYHVSKSGTGDVNYDLQGTIVNLEDGIDVSAGSSLIFDIVSAKTGAFFGHIDFPVAAVRLVGNSVSGNVDLTMLLMQSGN